MEKTMQSEYKYWIGGIFVGLIVAIQSFVFRSYKNCYSCIGDDSVLFCLYIGCA